MTDLYIHIGAPKTGTTAIQQYLLKNRDALAHQGVLYPSGGLFKSGHHILGASVFPGRGNRLVGISRDEALRTSVESIRKEVEERAPHTIVISTEYLWGELAAANVQRLLRNFADCSIAIVVYLRRQDLLAQSLYVQAVKGGLTDSFAVWLDREVDSDKAGFNFYRVLSCWKDSGMPVRVVARIYEKSQLSNDICSDFLSAVSPGLSLPPLADRVANTGPDTTTVELLRLVSRKIKDPKLAAETRRRILAHSPSRPLFSPLSYLSASEVSSFMARFAEPNERIAREFLQRPDGKLFLEALPTKDSEHPSDAGPSAVLERLASLLPTLLDGKEKRADAVRGAAIKQRNWATRPEPARKKTNMASL